MVEKKEGDVVSFDTKENKWGKLQHENQSHTKRIRDLIGIAQECRARLDALLGRKTSSWIDFDRSSYRPLSTVNSRDYDYIGDRSYNNERRFSRDSDVSSSSLSRKSTFDRDNDGLSQYDVENADRNRHRLDHDHQNNRSFEERNGQNGYDNERARVDHVTNGNDRSRVHHVTNGDVTRQVDVDDEGRYVIQNGKTEQVISHNNNQVVDVGSVVLTESKTTDPIGQKQQPIEFGISISPRASPTLVRKQKTLESKISVSPKMAKKPFKFGTISLQVQLDDE